MIRSFYFKQDGKHEINIPIEQYAAVLKDPKGMLWVDFSGESPQASEPILLDIFGFHHLAVDDALTETHVPKVDDWEQYLYIAMMAIHYHRGEGDIDSLEVDVFLGSNYLVSHHDLPVLAIDRVWESCERDPRYIQRGVDHLLYRLIDEMTSDYMLIVDEMDEEIEYLEDQVFMKPDSTLVQRIFTLKRATLHLRRTVSPMREVLNKLARDNYAMIDRVDQLYFRDVYDHLVRLYDIIESLRDLVGGVLDTYLSVINNRMNEIMKTLTIITTLFMPLTFLTGFFGMNFFGPVANFDAWVGPSTFRIAMIIIFLTPVVMFLWMRRRRWM
jgi:magnesium transporter